MLLASCTGGAEGLGPDFSHGGTYELISVDGKPLPVEAGAGRSVTHGQITLAFSSYYRQHDYLMAGNPPVSTPANDEGSFTVSGKKITFVPGSGLSSPEALPLAGSYDRSSIEYEVNGRRYRYERRL